MVIERIVVGDFFTNCYIIGCEEEKVCGIIDPGSEGEKIKKIIENKNLKPLIIINTHGHFDHIGANNFFNLPVYIHEDDFEFLKDPEKNLSSFFSFPYVCENEVFKLKENDVIKIGKLNIEVIHTPGHTPGSICLKIKDILFTGDTIFADGIGRTDFPEGDEEKLIKSIETKIFILNDNIKIFPGHGEISDLGKIKKWLKL
jgi:hydroxyacylglutathione hydrolase